MSRCNYEVISGKERRVVWGRKDEEYIADFCLLSRRALEPGEYTVFKYHFLLGADWRLCCRRLNIDRGTFFHAVYRIQQKLGRAFRETEPFGLYPLQEYFGGVARQEVVKPCDPNKVLMMRQTRRTILPERKAA